MQACCDEAGDVGDIGKPFGAALLRNLAEGGKVDGPRIGARPADEEVRADPAGDGGNLRIVGKAGIGVDAVADRIIEGS